MDKVLWLERLDKLSTMNNRTNMDKCPQESHVPSPVCFKTRCLNSCSVSPVYMFLSPWVCCFQFSSVGQSCPTLCDPMNRSTPGLSIHHKLPEFTQTHVHRVSDAIQPSHPLSSPSPPAPSPSQSQSLFQ